MKKHTKAYGWLSMSYVRGVVCVGAYQAYSAPEAYTPVGKLDDTDNFNRRPELPCEGIWL